MDIKLLAVDLAKNVFQVCALGEHNNVIFNKKLTRSKFHLFMAQQPQSPVYMEACYSAHYWGRTLNEMGHKVHLIPAQMVKPFVRGNKNDNNDALAIAEAGQRPHIRFVPVKSIHQQEILAMHRVRQRLIKSRTQLTNQARGLLSDFGVVFPKGFKHFKKALVSLQDDESLSLQFKQMMLHALNEFEQMTDRIEAIEEDLNHYIKSSHECQIISSIPGIGPINASALIASIDKGQAFNNPKEFAVWLGLTPRQYNSGDTVKTGGITKRGDRYLRTMLVQGAHTVTLWANKRDDPLSLWVKKIVARIGKKKAVVAIAHRMARLVWILLQRNQKFNPQHLN